MRRFVAGLCCLIVGLQVLIGVPAVVTVALLCLWTGGEFALSSTVPPPHDVSILPPPADAHDKPGHDAILESRQRNGNPLAGTALGGVEPGQDDRDFAAAFQFVAAEAHTDQIQVPLVSDPLAVVPLDDQVTVDAIVVCPARPAVATGAQTLNLNEAASYLYLLADQQETNGCFSRADELRSLARAIRREVTLTKSAAPAPPGATGPYTAVKQPPSTVATPSALSLPSGPSSPEMPREAGKPAADPPRAN